MSNYDIDNWIVGILISLRELATESGRETIADRLDDTILTVANDGHQLSAQELQRSRNVIQRVASLTNTRRVH